MPVPHDRPTLEQIMHALRTSGEAGDILCSHAAEQVERLMLTDEEREAIQTAINEAEAHQHASRAATLRELLDRLA